MTIRAAMLANKLPCELLPKLASLRLGYVFNEKLEAYFGPLDVSKIEVQGTESFIFWVVQMFSAKSYPVKKVLQQLLILASNSGYIYFMIILKKARRKFRLFKIPSRFIFEAISPSILL